MKRYYNLYSKGLIVKANKIKNRRPGTQQATLVLQLQQNDVYLTRKIRMQQNTNPNESDGSCYRALDVAPTGRTP